MIAIFGRFIQEKKIINLHKLSDKSRTLVNSRQIYGIAVTV